MIREAIGNFQISPNLTNNIMQEIARLKPAPPAASKPLVPWVIGAASAVLIALMLGIGGQYLTRFQKPYSLDAQSETTIELVDAPIVQNLEAKPVIRNQQGALANTGSRSDSDGENANQIIGDKGDWTRWNLPEGAKRRLGKGILNDMQLSPDSTRLAIAGDMGIWLYDVNTGDEIAFITDHKHEVENPIPRVVFSPDGKTLATKGHGRKIWLWDADTGKHMRTIKVPNAPATGYQFFKDGTWATTVIPLSQFNPEDDRASVIGFGEIGRKNKKTKATYIVTAGPLLSFKFLADSPTLVTQNLEGTVWFWDITNGEQTATFSPKLSKLKLDPYMDWVSYSPDDWRIATDVYINPSGEVTFAIAAGDRYGTIDIQDGHTGKLVRTLTGQSRPINHKNSVDQIGHGQILPMQNRLRIPGMKYLDPGNEPRLGVEWITKLHFAPDGKTLVSKSRHRYSNTTSHGGAVELWAVDTGELLTRLPLGIDIKFSGDGKTAAFMGHSFRKNYEGCAVWDIATRTEIVIFPGKVNVKFSEDGKTFTIIRNERIEVWDIATRRQISALNTIPGQFMLLPERHTFSGDGTILAAVDRDGTVNLWQPRTGTQLHSFTTDYTTPISTLVFTHDSKMLASGNSEGNIQLWDLNTATVSTTLTSPANKYIGGLVFSIDNVTLISESKGNIEKWNISTGKIINSYTIPGAADLYNGRASHGSVSSDGVTFCFPIGVAVLTQKGGKIAERNSKLDEDGSKIGVLDIATGKHLCTVTDESPIARPLAFTSDEKMLVTLGEDIIYVWDTYTGEQLMTFNVLKNPVTNKYGHDIYAGVFTHDGKTLACGGSYENNSIFIWDIATQKHIATLSGHEYTICHLAFSADDTILASGDANGEIRLWKMPSVEPIAKFKSPGGHVSKLVFSPNGKTLASTNGNDGGVSSRTKQGGIIFLWDVPTNK